MRSKPPTTALASILLAVAFTATARAELGDIEVPVLILDEPQADAKTPAEDVDLSMVVQSAGKRIETTQESPAIVTVVSRDQIRTRGYRTLADLMQEIPGFESMRPRYYWRGVYAFARGNSRTILVLWNGVPLNNPGDNQRALGMMIPIEVIDRVEVLSGPGGVMWGANALLGIINIVTADAGTAGSHAEVGLRVGDGPGLQETMTASATLSGSLLRGRIKALANLTLVSTRNAALDVPYDEVFGPFSAPQKDGAFLWRRSSGPTQNPRDVYLVVTAVAEAGPFRLDVLYPFMSTYSLPIQSRGIRTDQYVVPGSGEIVPGTASTEDSNASVVALRYDRPLRSGRLVGRGYVTTFSDRNPRLLAVPNGFAGSDPIYAVDAPSWCPPKDADGNNVAGVSDESCRPEASFLADKNYRIGGGFDYTKDLSRHNLVSGIESYVEGIPNLVVHVEGLAGTGSDPSVQWHANRRLVTAIFANDRVRIADRLRVEGGVRAQYAPSAYAFVPLLSGALLYNPGGKIHLKANVAQGFRPPPLVDISRNDNSPLPVRSRLPSDANETSFSAEGEVSAVVLREHPVLRYLAFRAGYQYSELRNLVIYANGAPTHAGTRVMHTAEGRSEMVLRRGDRVFLGYHFLTGADAVSGPLRNVANHKLVFGGDLKLSARTWATFGAVVVGPREDLNRIGLTTSSMSEEWQAPPSAVVVDHIPTLGLLRAGLVRQGMLGGRFDLALHVENLLDARYFIPDEDFEKRESPYPMAGARASALLTLRGRM